MLEATNASFGHAALTPVQASATSHTPIEPRHTVPAAVNPFAGHAALEPVQLSATSHKSATARHTVPDAVKPSAGHADPLPLHVSATSHMPDTGRHTVPAVTLLQLVGPDTVTDPTVHQGSDQVFFGATVTYADESGQERTVTIMGIDEADSAQGQVSWISPVARALLKTREGDVAFHGQMVKRPQSLQTYLRGR